MGRVDVVLEKLLSIPSTLFKKPLAGDHRKWLNPSFVPGTPDVDPTTFSGKMSSHQLRMEEYAEKLVGLAREFVDALDEEGGGGMLRQRAHRFITLTEANPNVNIPRQKAYQRIMEAFRQASPDVEVESLEVSQLNMGTGSGADKHIHRSEVERYLGAGSLLWFPYRCLTSFRRLADITGNDEIASLADTYKNCLETIDAFHLWGCFLLLAFHDEVLPTADSRLTRALRFALMVCREASARPASAYHRQHATGSGEGDGGHQEPARLLRGQDIGRGNGGPARKEEHCQETLGG